jgi:hypothetical protein
MLNYLHSQQRSSTCAVAAIRTVLHWQFGVRVSESALVALGTNIQSPIIAHGSDTHDMRRMVREASNRFNTSDPWTLRVRKHGTVRQLAYWVRNGRWPIVQVYVKESAEHHAIVILDVDRERVCYFDPDPSSGKTEKWMPKDRFLEWWVSPVNGERWWSVINGGALVERP